MMQTWAHTEPYNKSDCKEEVHVTVRAGKSKHHSSRAGWEELQPGSETAAGRISLLLWGGRSFSATTFNGLDQACPHHRV